MPRARLVYCPASNAKKFRMDFGARQGARRSVETTGSGSGLLVVQRRGVATLLLLMHTGRRARIIRRMLTNIGVAASSPMRVRFLLIPLLLLLLLLLLWMLKPARRCSSSIGRPPRIRSKYRIICYRVSKDRRTHSSSAVLRHRGRSVRRGH